jgi:hypothetical protein
MPLIKINHNVTRVTLRCADQDYLHGRDTKGRPMLIETFWPAIGFLIVALPLIGAGIWAVFADHHHQNRADHWAQFGPAHSPSSRPRPFDDHLTVSPV